MFRRVRKMFVPSRHGGPRGRWSTPSSVSTGLMSGAVVVGAIASTLTPPGSLVAQTPNSGDPERGRSAYVSTCGGCHSIQQNRIGPRHKGLIGRQAGSESGYSYSKALREADFTWDEARLRRWLSNPRAMVPGTKMAVRVSDPQRRADIAAYLATQ